MSTFWCRGAMRSAFPAILTPNRQSEAFLSPLDRPKLNQISNEAEFFQVTTSLEGLVGFLLAFLPEANYDNPNFLWFKARYEHFIYIDRCVISEYFRWHHLSTRLYADLRTEAIA